MTTPESGYTVVIVPEGSGNIQRWRLSARRLRQLVVAALAVGVAGALSLVYTVYNLASLPDRWRLEEQMLAQQLHLAEIGGRLEQAEQTLERVGRLDRKLRVVLGESGQQDDGRLMGIGGPTPDKLARFDGLLDEESRLAFARLAAKVDDVGQSSKLQEMHLYDLDALMTSQSARLASTPSVWPTRGWVTSRFGPRVDPFTGRKRVHEGLDIATRSGNPVVATADGIVLFAGFRGDYGNYVVIDHGYGLVTRYGHLSSIDVDVGQLVGRGSLIGRVGSTGRSTGPHLHYEVSLAGVPVNPDRYILVDQEGN